MPTVGSKLVPVTPVPEYVPPTGEPPLKTKVPALLHNSENAPNVTDGAVLTVI